MSAKFGKGGNMFFQVEEAERSMKAHLDYIASAQPNKEIRDSKKPVIRFEKQNGKQRVMLKERERQNKLLMQRVYSIMHEERRPGSREYTPGYRVTSQGIPVIDCYPTELYVAKNFSRLHNAGVDRERRQKTIDKENKILHKHLVNVRSPYNARDLFKDYERKHRLQNGVKKLPHTALHLLHASHPKSPPIRPRSASPPPRTNRDNAKPTSSSIYSRDGKFYFPKEKPPQPEWNHDIKIQYSDVKKRPKSASFDGRGELKPLSGPSGPVHLSQEANAFVNFNMKQQNRPRSAHASANRNQLPPYPKAFPLPHINYPAPPNDNPPLQFPAPSAIREAIYKNIRSGMSTVRPISAPANRPRNDNSMKVPISNVPSMKRPKSAGKSISERFKDELAMSRREANDLPVVKCNDGDTRIAPSVSVATATTAAAAARKIYGSSSIQKSSKAAGNSNSFNISASPSVDPKDRILTSTEDKGPVMEGGVFASLRERYPPRRVIIQQCSVLPRIKFSGVADQGDAARQKFGGSLSKMNFDVRVVDVGVVCPAQDLPCADELTSSLTSDPRFKGITGTLRSVSGQTVTTIPTSTGVLVEAEYSFSSKSACSLFIPMRHLKNLSAFYRRNDILKSLKSIPVRDRKAGLFASMGECMNASEEGQLAELILKAIDVVYDPSTEKGKIVIKQPGDEEIQNALRQRPGSGKGVEGIGAKGFRYQEDEEQKDDAAGEIEKTS